MGAKCCSNEGGAAEKSGQLEDKGRARWSDAGGFPPDSAVRVTILGAKDLAHQSWRSGQGPNGAYCVCEIPAKRGTMLRTPPASSNARSPKWDFAEVMQFYEFPDALLFMVLDADHNRPNRHLGKAQLFASKLEEGNGTFEGSLLLAGVAGLDWTPTLDVKVEAVPRPKVINDVSAKEPASLPRGRVLRMGISKRGRPWGILVVKGGEEEEEVLVSELAREGAAEEHNLGSKVRDQLQVGDRIVEANGLQRVDQIIHEVSASKDPLELVVESRSDIFKVNFRRPPDAALGVELFYSQSGATLTVGEVTEGAVKDYNKTVPEEKQVLPKDLILGVNGERNQDPIERREAVLNAVGSVHLLIARTSSLPEEPKDQLVWINIAKGDQPLGAQIAKSSVAGMEGVFVEQIAPNMAAAVYNSTAEVQEQLHVGDRIVEVNGITGNEEIALELRAADRLELLVEHRCDIFKVRLRRPDGAQLGMDLKYSEDNDMLIVAGLVDGLVQDYNKTAPEYMRVLPDDHVLAVNGKRNQSPKERLQELQRSSGDVNLLIRRVFGLPPSEDEGAAAGAAAGAAEQEEGEEGADAGAAGERDEWLKVALMGFTFGSEETHLKSVFVAWAQEARQRKQNDATEDAAPA